MLIMLRCVKGVNHVHELGKNKVGNIHFCKDRFALVTAIREDLRGLDRESATWIANRTGESIYDSEDEIPREVAPVHDPMILTVEDDQEKIDERNRLNDTLRDLQGKLDALLVSERDLINEITAVNAQIDELEAEKTRLGAEDGPKVRKFQFQKDLTSELLAGHNENPALRDVENQLVEYRSRLDRLLEEHNMLKAQIEDFKGRVEAASVAVNAINDELRQLADERRRVADENEEERIRLAEEEARRRALEEEINRLNNAKFDDILRNLRGSYGPDALRAKMHLLFSLRRYQEKICSRLIKMIDITNRYADRLNAQCGYLPPYAFDASVFTFGNCETFNELEIPMIKGAYDINETFRIFIEQNQGKSITQMHQILDRMLDNFSNGSCSILLADMIRLRAIMATIDGHFSL